MLTAGLVLAGLAALLHVWIFWIESIVFESRGRKIFGVPAEHVPVTKQWAFNQGFYNLFLAVITAVGIAVCCAGDREAGVALVVAGTGSMLAAALVLVGNDRGKARGAVVQGTLPALALLALLVHALR